MNTKNLILGIVPPAIEGGKNAGQINSPAGYIIGAFSSIFLPAYLLYEFINTKKL